MRKIKSVGFESLVIEAMAPHPYGPQFTEDQIREADGLEIWAPDPGWGDYLEFRLVKDGKAIHVKQVDRW